MTSTCFETEGSFSGRQLYMQLWCGTLYIHRYKQVEEYRTHSSTYQTPYTDECKTYNTITVYTTVFLKMNPWF